MNYHKNVFKKAGFHDLNESMSQANNQTVVSEVTQGKSKSQVNIKKTRMVGTQGRNFSFSITQKKSTEKNQSEYA